MAGWLRAILGRKKKRRSTRYVLRAAETSHYHDEDAGGWRWARYDRFADREDPKGELMEARHSRPLAEDVSYPEAAAQSASFEGEFRDRCLEGQLIEHLSLAKASVGMRRGLSKWRLPDGSLLTQDIARSQPEEE